jgi:CO dehydrogenase/acetyl-CoA synthase beta subunit
MSATVRSRTADPVVGPEIDDIEEGAILPIGIYVKVYGRKMQRT